MLASGGRFRGPIVSRCSRQKPKQVAEDQQLRLFSASLCLRSSSSFQGPGTRDQEPAFPEKVGRAPGGIGGPALTQGFRSTGPHRPAGIFRLLRYLIDCVLCSITCVRPSGRESASSIYLGRLPTKILHLGILGNQLYQLQTGTFGEQQESALWLLPMCCQSNLNMLSQVGKLTKLVALPRKKWSSGAGADWKSLSRFVSSGYTLPVFFSPSRGLPWVLLNGT